MKFEELKLSNDLKKALEEIGYTEATKIQEKAIPIILEGKDLIGQSQTGTGKTASYSLPMIENIDVNSRKTQAIVLCPTRELAIQVSEEMRKYTKYVSNLRTLAVYGGQGIDKQISMLKGGVQIIIGTPGRVMDHLRRKTIRLDNTKLVVLDEADEMLNMGFEEDMVTILEYVPKERQTVLFSATMNQRIRNIAKKYLTNPENVKIETKELTVENIEQIAIEVKKGMKDEALMRLIDINEPTKAIVFCNTKRKVDELIDNLKRNKYKAEALHGDIKQEQRDRIMKKLKNGEFQILVATDVAARGIDIDGLDLVINYDIPQEDEYYVHRIGRTGRNGNIGKAITFVYGKERRKLDDIAKYAKTKIKYMNIPTITEINNIKQKKLFTEIQKIIDDESYENEDMFNKLLENNSDIENIAKALFTLYTKNTGESKKEEKKLKSNSEGNVRLFLNVGKKDKIMVKDIVGSILTNTAIGRDEIGKINILDKFSFMDVPSNYVEEILHSMKGKQVKGRNVNIEIASNK